MAIASWPVRSAGRWISQSERTRAMPAKPPMWDSPTPNPFSSTLSPVAKSVLSEAVTVPVKSMPGIIGKRRTTGLLPVTARPSL